MRVYVREREREREREKMWDHRTERARSFLNVPLAATSSKLVLRLSLTLTFYAFPFVCLFALNITEYSAWLVLYHSRTTEFPAISLLVPFSGIVSAPLFRYFFHVHRHSGRYICNKKFLS